MRTGYLDHGQTNGAVVARQGRGNWHDVDHGRSDERIGANTSVREFLGAEQAAHLQLYRPSMPAPVQLPGAQGVLQDLLRE
ncbi:MAG: hypothetical protein AAFO79_00895 [Pseudomonadota bacterium]